VINPEKNFQDFFFSLSLKTESKLANVPVSVVSEDLKIYNGRMGGAIALGIVGGAIGFFTGGTSFLFTGLTLGFALGSALFGSEPKKKKKPRAPSSSFSSMSGDDIAIQGSAIPIIYASRSKNPKGGVRATGKLIACKVENLGDSAYQYNIIALSLGEIGTIDSSLMLIDGQTIERFYAEDLTFNYLIGTPTYYNDAAQGSLPTEFNFFGQCITPNTYNLLGSSRRAQSKSTSQQGTTVAINTWQTSNCYVSGRNGNSVLITKNAGSTSNPDAYAQSNENVRDGGGSIGWSLTNNRRVAVGYGTRGSSNITYGILNDIVVTPQPVPPSPPPPAEPLTVTTYPVVLIHNGSPVAISGATWSVNDTFQVELGNDGGNKVVKYSQNGNLLVAYSGVNWGSLPAKGVIYDIGTSINITSSVGISFPTGNFGVDVVNSTQDTATLVVYEDEQDSIENWSRFTPAEIYEVNSARFRVLKKNDASRQITITPSVNISEDDDIYCVWESYYQTSKKVTNIVINFEGMFFSRRKPVNADSGKAGGKK
jgi:hypothetical protein